jgi:hypothetical protein
MLRLRLLHLEFCGPDSSDALDYLQARGFYLDSDLQWRVPHGFKFTRKDYRAVEFLSLEWGYGADIVQDDEVIPPRHRFH